MIDFYDFTLKCNENLKEITDKAITEIPNWYDNEYFSFKNKNKDYRLFLANLKFTNELSIKNLKAYHDWLCENFIVSPKNQ